MKYRVKIGGLLLTASAMLAVALYMTTPQPAYPDEVGTDPSNTPTVKKPLPPQTSSGRIVASDERDDQMPWFIEKSESYFAASPKPKKSVIRPAVDSDFITINDKTYPIRTYEMLQTPNDPYAAQWWIGPSGAANAWDIAPGAYQTTLAVIDSGFALSHEEFTNRWAVNAGESGTTSSEGASLLNCSARTLPLDYSCNLVDDNVDGIVDNESGAAPYENPSQLNCSAQGVTLDKTCNRLDDDNNGYVDDALGWDMINQDSSVQTGQLSPNGSATNHGTMVAGMAAATGNNSLGIAGVNWQTKVLPIQALDDDGYGNTKSVGDSIYYAVSRGVDVINISLGTAYHDEYVRDAVEAATAAGITIVASSGNDGCDCIVYPARYPEVLAVGALDASNNRASFSSWGSALDIVAPGASLTLPSWSTANPTSRYSSGVAGTSFSSPWIAGAVALAKSHQPNARPLHLISSVRETASRVGFSPLQVHDVNLGYGKANVSSLRTRLTTPKHFDYAYQFSPIATGNYFAGQNNEYSASYVIQDCNLAQASMPVYELKNSINSFFTISEVETRSATLSGYSASLFAHSCMRLPHDTVGGIRTIDLFREFRNVVRKF
jgi:subtilisin family serine protease